MRWLCLVLLVACVDDPARGPSTTSRVARVSFPLQRLPEQDVLFVVDNSPAMAAHRERILANARNFMNVLATVQGSLDLHVGVITTDVAADGGAMHSASAVTGRFLVEHLNPDLTRTRNFTGAPGEVLAAMLDVGTTGSPEPRPLDAIRGAIANPVNTGFRRPTADLAIVILTPNDDHGDRELAEDVDFLRALAGERTLVIGAAMGPPRPNLGSLRRPPCAVRAARLADLLERFPNRATSTTICQADLSGVFNSLGGMWPSSVGNPCLGSPLLDADPETAGLQRECNAWLEHRDGAEVLVEEVLPPCGGDDPARCYRIVEDKRNCPDNSLVPPTGNLMVDLNDRFARAPTLAVVECVVE